MSVELLYSNATADPDTCGRALGWQPASAIAAAVRAARVAVVFVFVFANRAAGEAMDHGRLDLPGEQNQLIAAVAANPRTIVALNTDSPVSMPWLDQDESVVQAWHGGRGMGTAPVAVLFGNSDPSGRLPVTFPAGVAQSPGATLASYPGRTPPSLTSRDFRRVPLLGR